MLKLLMVLGVLATPCLSHAQNVVSLLANGRTRPLTGDTMLTIRQDTIPHADSGGRWTGFDMVVTNLTQDTIWLQLPAADPHVTDSVWKASAAATKLADSAYGWNEWDMLVFNIPPHKQTPDVRIPYLFRSIALTQTYADFTYTDKDKRTKGVYADNLNISGFGACPGPEMTIVPGALTNKNAPFVYGSGQSTTWGGYQGNYLSGPDYTTTASFKITGEYADSFAYAGPLTLHRTEPYSGQVYFYGAPKYLVHDTISCTYTNCYGTVTFQDPIAAYSVYNQTHSVSATSLTLKAPFLGTAEETFTITNLTPIAASVKMTLAGRDQANFAFQGPATIAGKDSAVYTLRLMDNDKAKDLARNDRTATLSVLMRSADPDQLFVDSTFSIDVTGRIDVWCPRYASLVPLIEHGVHPAGMIFGSGDAPFTTDFGNNDSVARMTYPPAYDDLHLSITPSGFPLPMAVPAGAVTPCRTTFSGSAQQNYLTKLRWPRDIDTIVMDVLVLGAQAQPFDAVRPHDTPTVATLWPNPASTSLHVGVPMAATVSICDALGRIVQKQILPAGESTIGLTELPAGIYEVFISGEAHKLQILR